MSITPPWSAELTAQEEMKDVELQDVEAVVIGKMKIFLNVDVNPQTRQSIVGSLRNCFKLLMLSPRGGDATDNVAHGNYLDAVSGNISIDTDVLSIGDAEVALIVSSTFQSDQGSSTHMWDETFKQLLAVFLEQSKDN